MLFVKLCECFYLLSHSDEENPYTVLESCTTNHNLYHSQIFNMNQSFRNTKSISTANFLNRLILLSSIGILFLPKATGNQYS